MKWEWSEGKHLTDCLLEMGFLGAETTFRKRAALADYLDAYFDRQKKEREERERDMNNMRDFYKKTD